MRVGIVGCGNISGIYFQNLAAFSATEVVAVADLDMERARSVAERESVPLVLSPDDLIAHPDVELVLNLTIPAAHAEVSLKAVSAGKHVYAEKPFGLNQHEAVRVVEAAVANGVRTGSAPDTFLGGGHQTARAAIERGDIGEPIGSHAFMLCHGHESWHPSPEFYYKKGGGPMFDMGPYYLTALVNMMGPVACVMGMTRITFPTRTITSQPQHGTVVEVEIPTHVAGMMHFGNGAIGEITTSFDVWHSKVPNILVYGTEGSLMVPDPNGFGGEVLIRKPGMSDWEVVPNRHGFNINSRGIGVLDMAVAIRSNRAHRASAELATHTVALMESFHVSHESGTRVEITTGTTTPMPLHPAEFDEYVPKGFHAE
jgi:predicted dehydrogenase